MTRRLTFVCVCLAAACPAALLGADDPTELAYRQKFIHQQFAKLTRTMLDVADLLAESDPAAAAAIRKAVAEARKADVAANMRKVAKHLDGGLAAVAGAVEKDVLADLRRVLKLLQEDARTAAEVATLRKFREDLTSIGKRQKAHAEDQAATPRHLDRRRAGQRTTAERTGKVLRDMENAGKDGAPIPGQESVQQAVKDMDLAIGELRRRQPEPAHKKQVEASGHIDEAVREISDVIGREDKIRRDMTAARIERMLREALEAQRRITASTAETFARRTGERHSRKDVIELVKLSDGEGALAATVGKVLALVKTDGTATVFPAVLEEVRVDLKDVQKRLGERLAGRVTQGVQKQIEQTLASMLSALAADTRRRRKDPTTPPPPPPGDGAPPRRRWCPSWPNSRCSGPCRRRSRPARSPSTPAPRPVGSPPPTPRPATARSPGARRSSSS